MLFGYDRRGAANIEIELRFLDWEEACGLTSLG